MVWSHNDQWMVTGDTGGFVKYWQTNMNNVKLFQAHKDPVRGLRYPHLCHRPLSIITVTTTTTTTSTSTHFHSPPLLLWDIHYGCRRFYIRRCRHFLLSLVHSAFHSSIHGYIGLFWLSWAFFLVLVCHIGTSSTILTLYFTSKPGELSQSIETLYYTFLVCMHPQIIKEQLSLIFFFLYNIYTFYFNICFLKIINILTLISWSLIPILLNLTTSSVFCNHNSYLH